MNGNTKLAGSVICWLLERSVQSMWERPLLGVMTYAEACACTTTGPAKATTTRRVWRVFQDDIMISITRVEVEMSVVSRMWGRKT